MAGMVSMVSMVWYTELSYTKVNIFMILDVIYDINILEKCTIFLK